jgi:hypothetical protein
MLSRYPPLPSYWWLPEKGYEYCQEFLENNLWDLRIIIIGDNIFGESI